MIKYLKKYNPSYQVQKTDLYKDILQYKEDIQNDGFSFSIKTWQDLFEMEIIKNSVMTKKKVEQTYDHFISQNFDALEYINYDQQRKMLNQDLQVVLETCMFFYNDQHKKIYMPHLEEFVNERYADDYQVMTLKQHHVYLQQYPRILHQPFLLYHDLPLRSDFSSLHVIGKDEEYLYGYFDETHTVYVFNNDMNIVEELCFQDKKSEPDISIEDIKEIVQMYLLADDQSLLDELYQRLWINEKTYKKISKKIK